MTIDASRLMAMRSAILEQNSALQRAAGMAGTGAPGSIGGPEATQPGGFGQALQTALRQVNETQARSSAMTEAYERGETTDIAAVMLARQQASLGFEATLQVRNRLLTAYKDIMSMPV
ncbi:MAG TPA: flagellar hook-basal body complex protein FliE [Allosphingosinicella sp.]|nr:flagellar hook-basal body complex protein FliE [Allosphingosinicella sp.]